MKKIEIKKVSPGNLFKVMVYFLVLPMAIMLLVGMVVGLIGIVTGNMGIIFMAAFLGLGYPLLFIVIYGVMALLQTLVYNVLASRFGGLEITVDEEDVKY